MLVKGFCFVLCLEWRSPFISKEHQRTQQPAFYAMLVRVGLCGHLSLQSRLGKETPGKGMGLE